MKHRRSRIHLLSHLMVTVYVSVLAAQAMALISGGSGNSPVHDYGWPQGIVEIANLPERLGYWEGPPFGGGEYHFGFRCPSTEEFNRVLRMFSEVNTPELLLSIHDGEGPTGFFSSEKSDWTLTVWVHENWNRLSNGPGSRFFTAGGSDFARSYPVPPPKIDVYLGGESGIEWDGVAVPHNVCVIDERAGAVSEERKGDSIIKSTLYDMTSAKPVAGAKIQLTHTATGKVCDATSSQGGSVEFTDLRPGTYTMSIRADGYASRVMNVGYLPSQATHTVISKLAKKSTLRGRVVNEKGEPVNGVEIAAMNIRGIDNLSYHCEEVKPIVSDEEGVFQFESLPEGYTELKLKWPGAKLFMFKADLYRVPSQGYRIRFETPGVIEGKVLKPAKEKTVNVQSTARDIYGFGYTTSHGDDGSFRIGGVPPGEYRIGTDTRTIFGFDSDDSGCRYVRVKPGETTYVEIEE